MHCFSKGFLKELQFFSMALGLARAGATVIAGAGQG